MKGCHENANGYRDDNNPAFPIEDELWQLHHVLNNLNLKRMWMTPLALTFVVFVSARTKRMWGLVESGFRHTHTN